MEHKVINDKFKRIFYIKEPFNITEIIQRDGKEIFEASENYNIIKKANYLKVILDCVKYYNLYKSYKQTFDKYGKIIDLENIKEYKLEQIYDSDFFKYNKPVEEEN